MTYNHYYQEDSDVGLKLAALFLQLSRNPSALSKAEWDFLNMIPIGTLVREASNSRKEAVHVLNQIDRLEADVSRMGRFEHLTDAFMMWIVGGSFILAAVLLAVLSIPESVAGRVSIPISIGVGLFFIFIPLVSRKRAMSYKIDCFRETIINILGTGLMKRSVLTTDAVIRELDRHEPEKTLKKVIEKFLAAEGRRYPKYEEKCLMEQLLDGYRLKLSDLSLLQAVGNSEQP